MASRGSTQYGGIDGGISAMRTRQEQLDFIRQNVNALAYCAWRGYLAETSGRDAAIEHLRKVCSRFPQNFRLQQLLLEHLRAESEAEAEPVIRNIVGCFPDNAWARRELAVVLSLNRKRDEALAEARTAISLAPNHSYGFSVLGSVLRGIGNFPEAREAYRQAIRLDVDNSFGIESLIKLGECVEDKRRELEFIHAELVRQVVYGDGLIAYKNVAQGLLNPEELLASLSEALEARLDLWHAWSVVTTQLVVCKRLADAEARAREMVRRFPLVPGSWRVLGGIYTHQENWNSAAEAFEKAVELNLAWNDANFDWANACIKAGQQAKARSILEKFVNRCPLDEYAYGNLADLLHSMGEKETALEHLRQAVRLSPGYDWAWEKLRAWGKEGEALQLARELTRTRAGEARSWFILAENLIAKENLAERMEALDRAIELNPQYGKAYDTKASILADEERYDEALAACTPPVWNGHPPTFLLGRSAWIECQRGDRKRAIEIMRRALTEDDSYRWGWQNLADWLDEEKEYAGALAAAEKLVFWYPKGAASFGYRGYAKQQLGDKVEALKDYEKAYQMDPEYTFAGWRLFNLCLDGERFKEAEATLDSLAKVEGKEWISSAEIPLALRQRQVARAEDSLRKLATLENPDADAFKNVEANFEKAKALRRLDRTLKRLVNKATLNGPAADLWARREMANGRWFFLPAIRRLMGNEAAARSAVYAWLSGVNQTCPRQLKFGVKALMAQHADWMRRDTQSWGILGQALYEGRWYDDAATWLSDWKDRQDAAPWMLTNLSFALRVLGRHGEASEVSRCVVERNGTDYNTTTNRVFLAVDLALAGNCAESLSLLEPVKESDLHAREQWLGMLSKAIVDLHNHGIQNGQKAIFREALRKLRACGSTVGFCGVAFSATAQYALREMAKMTGCVFPWAHGLFMRRRYFPSTSSGSSTLTVGSRHYPLWKIIWWLSWLLFSILRILPN
ncbi:MAG: tetratricopeptide repeat protein [Chthoniobacteraceae bacterium]